MPSLNSVILMGHLGSDPEQRFTQTGKAVATLKIATTEKRGENETTTWHTVIAWEHLARQAEGMSKGDLVYVQGKIATRSYEKDGQKRYVTEIVASLLVKCLWVKGEAKAQEPKKQREDFDDSLPF